MSTTSLYLNFTRNTEEAFNFYKTVFKTEFVGKVARFGEAPADESRPIAETDKNLIMHVALPILGGFTLMGTDAPESLGLKVNQGNNFYISLHPETRSEADRLFSELSSGGVVEMPMQDMFWGDYFGSCRDQFGIQWMVNYSTKE